MKTILIYSFPFLFFGAYFLNPFGTNSCCSTNINEGRCTGSQYCTACTTCEYCAHCSNGGSCGVCTNYNPPKKYNSPSKPTYTSSATQKAINYNNRYDYESRKVIENFLYDLEFLSLYQVDGIIDSNTIEAIKKFQEKVGLTADGCFGPGTIKKAETYIGN